MVRPKFSLNETSTPIEGDRPVLADRDRAQGLLPQESGCLRVQP